MVIDFHVHMFPEKLAERALCELSEKCGMTPEDGGSIPRLRALKNREGVDMAVGLGIATNPKQMHNVNLFAKEVDSQPDFIGFGSVHPDGDWEYELDFLKDSGIRGVKLHPDYQGFYIDDPKLQPIYEGILSRGFVLIFHSGVDWGMPDPVHASVSREKNTLGLFRGEKVVFSHSGGFEEWDEVAEHLAGEDIYLDTSMTLGFLEKERREALYRAHKKDKILFGTDSPWASMKKEVEGILALAFDEEWKEGVLHRNAERLLGLSK